MANNARYVSTLSRPPRAWAVSLFFCLGLWFGGPAVAETPSELAAWSVERLDAPAPTLGLGVDPSNLVLDDGTREANIGFGGGAARQFLWFNRFDSPSPSSGALLEEIRVLFPPSSDYDIGDAIQLVVYRDLDQDPTNGAELLSSFDGTIQAVDGTKFSVYPVEPPLAIPPGDDILLGVINRFVESGVSSPSRPAALDTSASQLRSYFAIWADDPPAQPELSEAMLIATIDSIEPGNWMIRGVASDRQPVDIPVLDGRGLLSFALILGLFGIFIGRRGV